MVFISAFYARNYMAPIMGNGFCYSLGMRIPKTGSIAQKAALARRFSTGLFERFAEERSRARARDDGLRRHFGCGTIRR
jgi:hypothetical protein